MVNVGAFLAGGLLQGVGQGIVKQADDARAAAVAQFAAMREVGLKNMEINAHHDDTNAIIKGEDSRSQRNVDAENTRSTNRLTSEEKQNQARITADAPLKAAQANYYENVKGTRDYTDDEGYAMQRGPDGELVYMTDADGNKKKLKKIGGDARSPEGVIGAIADDLQKHNKDLSRADALAQARSAPKNSAETLRRESLALSAFKDDELNSTKQRPAKSLDEWRVNYGLTPKTATPGPAPGLVPPAAPAVVAPAAAAPAVAPAAAPAPAPTPAPTPPPVVNNAPPPAAPVDPAQRVIGQKYTGKGGQIGVWTAQGWQVVPNAP